MKQWTAKYKRHVIRKQKKKYHEQLRAAKIRKRRKKELRLRRVRNPEYYEVQRRRKALKREIYSGYSYSSPPVTVEIEGEFGFEVDYSIQDTLDIAAQLIDFNASELLIDLKKCPRVWPSGVVLLCSLAQWVELTRPSRSSSPRVGSTEPQSWEVNKYLNDCGFYRYVGHPKEEEDKSAYGEQDIVKIHRETKNENLENREDQIKNLLESRAKLSQESIEWIDSVILTEVFNNVTEHGVAKKDTGWWVLAQYHPRHKILSLSVADNGIGIRNSLMSGPQRHQISKSLSDSKANDGEFIVMALTQNVSGAIQAPLKKGLLWKDYETRCHRGYGFERIREKCEHLSIPFAILSHHGYAFVSAEGEISPVGSYRQKIFAGTMYHFKIPAGGKNDT